MSEIEQQIIAIGGGGWLEPQSATMSRYLLEQAKAAKPKICFLPTASGDDANYIKTFYAEFGQYECEPSHVEFFGRTPILRDALLSQDVIFVGGGNTKSMLAVWREWGVDEILREAYEAGTVLAGVSAGAICWFEQAVTDSFAGDLAVIDGLGWLPGSACPHFNGEADRRPAFHKFVERGQVEDGYAIDDHVAIHFVDGSPARFVATQAMCSAYWVTKQTDGSLNEIDLTAEQLPRR